MTAAVKDDVGPKGGRAPHAQLMHRFRLLAVSTVLMALAFIQDPGRIAADTKLDLAVNPMGFLSRALTLWEPLGFFGQLQNQAYGYLFPVGPFFVLGDLAGLPAWVVQRLWWSAVLIGAFLGAVRLARLLGVRGEGSRIIAGLAYALAPRMVTEIGVLTVEVVPFAVAPWVVIPLVMATQGRYSLRRGAALSGIAVLFAGGVNAVATIAVLPLGLLWIVTRCHGRVRWVLTGWWALAVGLATLWWVIPLMILGRYSPPFLDWIESSSITTLVTSPDTVLRGTSQWVAYVAEPGGPSWPGGWALVTTPVLILAGGLVAAIGLTGLALRSTPYRSFLVGGVLMGFTLVSLGHTGVVQGFGAEAIQDLMDGALAPLRNTHKFDLVLRLPLAIGVGFAMDALIRRLSGKWTDASRYVAAGMVVLLTISAWPMVTGSLVRDRSFEGIPEYWVEVADWLAEESPHGRALVVPGASFGIYAWGRTQDEPLQPLAKSPWAIRDAVPLSSAGNIRWLDAIQERLDTGRGSPRLADALARAGVEYVVVRNDIDRRRSDTPRTVLIRQALVKSGGFTPVAGFGPALPPLRTALTVIDDGLQDAVAAIEIWRVASPLKPEDPRVVLRDASRVSVVSGSAESLLDLADADALGAESVITLGDEVPLSTMSDIDLAYAVTDGFRRTELNVGTTRDNRSQTLQASDPLLQDRRVHDYLPVEPEGRQAVALYTGAVPSASSSGSDATSLRARSSAAQPWAAIDGDPATSWVSGELAEGVGQWWEVTADKKLNPSWIDIRLVVGEDAGIEPSRVTVTTDAGEITVPVTATDQPQRLPVPQGETRRVRLTLDAVSDGGPGEAFGLREVEIPGLELRRVVSVAGAARGGSIVLTARKGEQTGCASIAGRLVCSQKLGRFGEERTGLVRIIEIAEAQDFRMRMWVRPRAGASLNGLLAPAFAIAPRADASSVLTIDAGSRAQAAVDGVQGTSWVASPLDTRPVLNLAWGESRRIRGVRLVVDPLLAASRPLRVTVTVNSRETTDVVSERGTITVPAQEATSLSIRFDNADVLRSIDPETGVRTDLPIGVSEVRILGAEDIGKGPRLEDRVAVPCGFGPQLTVDGEVRVETSVSSTVGDTLTDGLISATPCGERIVTLLPGKHVIEALSTAQYAVETVALEPVTTERSRSVMPLRVEEWEGTRRAVTIEAEDAPRILETMENANVGWEATIADQLLVPLRVEGWRQAWLVPPGVGGTITMDFRPQVPYVSGMALGGAAVTVLIVLAAPLGASRGKIVVRHPRTRWRWGPAVAVALMGAVIGGWLGVVVSVASLALAYVAPRVWMTGILAAGAAVGSALMPWPARLEAPLWLTTSTGLLAVGALASAAASNRWPKRGEPIEAPGAQGGTMTR